MEDKLSRVQLFFEENLKIKELINKPLDIKFGDDMSIDYENCLCETLSKIEFEFEKLAYIARIGKDEIENKFKAYRTILDNCGFNLDKLQNFYRTCFINMSDEIINKSKNEFIGYSLNKNIYMLLNESTSINEMLHVVHSYMVNDEKLYKDIPKLSEKKYKNGEDVNLYGIESKMARDIFNWLPDNSENGVTDILSLPNKTVMMIRDRGHALSLEIEKENDKVYVKYFIPKICNLDMVNKLQGVHQVKTLSTGTTGEFISNNENVGFDVASFIEKVPTDMDINDLNIYKSK